MIQQIMVYAVAVAAVLGVAALGLERLAALRGRPRRTAWMLALLLSVLLPMFMIQRVEPARTVVTAPAPTPTPMRVTQAEPIVDMPAPRHTASVPITPQPEALQPSQQPAFQPVLQPVQPSRDWRLPQLPDRSLLQAWAIASLLSGLYLIGAHLRLRRRISGWQRATLQGRAVLISETMGPALVGVFRPRMVIPRWLLDEPLTTQSLILEHERQHIVARDPLLIRAGVVLLAALPWNLPLWWQWRRMRQAIELDCDERVLRAGAEPQTYGEVLLSITGRATRMPSGVVAMSEPVSALERRIQNLLPDPVRYAALQVTGAMALLAAGVGAAIAMEAPVLPARAPLPTVSAPSAATTAPPIAAPLASVLAAAAAAPAANTNIEQSGPSTPATAIPDDGSTSLRDKALRAAVQKYPELINGPALAGYYYYVMIVVRADGTVFRSTLSKFAAFDQANTVDPNIIPLKDLQRPMDVVTGGNGATYGSGAMAGVLNMVLNRRLHGIRLDTDYYGATGIGSGEAIPGRPFDQVTEGPQTAKIAKGQQIADKGQASNDIEALWRVLPADYDESRDSRRVTEIVRAKHDDLMLATPVIGTPMPNINLLTVFMTEDGQIAREAVELLDDARYKSLNPQPVNAESVINARGEPYTSYNPPPVPADAFKVLGLDAAQIGQTGFLLVDRERLDPASLQRSPLEQQRAANLHGVVLVRYAWPRRPGELIGGKEPALPAPTAQRTQFVPAAPAPLPQAAPMQVQELARVSATDLVISASWAKRTDDYVLQLVLDAAMPAYPLTSASSTPAADRANTIAKLTRCGGTHPLFDGWWEKKAGQEPTPATISFMNQPYPPKHKYPRVDVWLLKTDGTQIQPATYSCEAGPVNLPSTAQQHPIRISYEFPLASADQAIAAAIRIDDNYYIEKLQPAPKPAAR